MNTADELKMVLKDFANDMLDHLLEDEGARWLLAGYLRDLSKLLEEPR